jgi:hypothetical protein
MASAQASFNPRLYRMIFDIVRFNLFALDLLNQAPTGGKEISIGEYLDREGYGDGFKDDYLLVRQVCHPKRLLTAAYDRCYLVDTRRPSRPRFPCLNLDSLFPQSSPSSAHREAKMAHSTGWIVSAAGVHAVE